MQVQLEVVHDKANVKRVILSQDAVIGRSSECNLRIASKGVSRQHCRIQLTPTGVLVRDMGSANGTWLNGERLESGRDVAVVSGSELSLGGVRFHVKYEAPVSGGNGPGSTVELPPGSPLPEADTDSPAGAAEERRKRQAAAGAVAAAEAEALQASPADTLPDSTVIPPLDSPPDDTLPAVAESASGAEAAGGSEAKAPAPAAEVEAAEVEADDVEVEEVDPAAAFAQAAASVAGEPDVDEPVAAGEETFDFSSTETEDVTLDSPDESATPAASDPKAKKKRFGGLLGRFRKSAPAEEEEDVLPLDEETLEIELDDEGEQVSAEEA
ncbi:MAG: FHA domain-containing protein, partial [Planctomycetaceae bacterium]|nr:FHA domain-containing protein [Planctomycetaceae bacterium]